MARLHWLAVPALLLGLAGCSTTVFESLPTGATTDCDPAWPGRWQPINSSSDAIKPDGALEIAADCRSAITKGERKPMRLTLVQAHAGQYLELHNDSGEPDCIGKDKAHCGHVLLRYEREGDTIRLYDPDHAKVAAAINGKKIQGVAERPDGNQPKGNEPTYRNFIAGDGKRIARLLDRHPEFFIREPLMVLRRIPADATLPVDAAAAPAATPEP
ncbi:MAG TPA: hypothetical protein VN205_07810 [Thermomonas sp.]|nr:hypothetical protein [Thermomonas sp.]